MGYPESPVQQTAKVFINHGTIYRYQDYEELGESLRSGGVIYLCIY